MSLYGARGELLGGPNKNAPRCASRRLFALSLFGLVVSCSDPIWSEGPTFFYEVETTAGTSYLLGTTHVGVSLDELPEYVRARLSEVDSVGFETEPSAPLLDAELFELGLIPRYDPILSQRLPPQVFTDLVALLDGRVDEVRLRRFQPWLARFALGLMFIEGLPRLEVEIETAVSALGKPLFRLETQREQLEVLASIPEDEVIASLTLMATDPEGARRELAETIAAYGRGDAPHFERTFLEPADSAEVELLIRARNRRWVEPIRARFEAGPSFLAVGAAHLVGAEGLLVLLPQVGLALVPSEPH